LESLKAYWRELPFAVDTPSAFQALFGSSAEAFWLDSAAPQNERSRWSFMGDASGPLGATVSYDVSAGQVKVQERGNAPISYHESIFTYLDRTLRGPPLGGPPCPFSGGHIGWFGYELRGECCPPPVTHRADTPDAFFLRPDRFLAIDHLDNRTYVVALATGEHSNAAKAWIDDAMTRLEAFSPFPFPAQGTLLSPLVFQLRHNRQNYLNEIEQALHWIGEGQTYQVCLTNELSCSVALDPFTLYRNLRQNNPAPFAAFLRWAGGAVLCASPERFLSMDVSGRVETKPIKGTIKRARSPEEDRLLRETLANSEKDRAENLMIVDLLRNDLARVCEVGSVQVPSLMAIESFATVHQMVSTIEGQLRADRSGIDLIKAAFPGGSMTGAPKIHTLGLIDRLERRARGIYSGALGWIGNDGAMDLNIVIRTIVAREDQLHIGVGGGIVVDSQAEAEFDEMLLKAQALIHAVVLTATGGVGVDRYHMRGVKLHE
jgi:para-aminobenzoate synthetase